MRAHTVVLLDEHLDIIAIQVPCTPAVETEVYIPFAAVFLFGGSATAVPSPLEARDWLYCVRTPCSLDDQ